MTHHQKTTIYIKEIQEQRSQDEERIRHPGRTRAVEHCVGQEAEVEHGHADGNALDAGEARPDRSGEHRPPNMIVRKLPHPARLQQVSRVLRCVRRHRVNVDVILKQY